MKQSRIALILCALALVGAGLAAGPSHSASDLEPFALSPDFARIGDFIVGTPDFTGCPTWEVHEIRAEHIGGKGDRSKSRWHSFEGVLPERPIGDKDYQHEEKSKEHPQGIARGHQNPAADESQDQDATDSTHSFANCVPQDQAFNAQAWERAEKRGRDLALLAKKMKVGYRVVSIEVPLYCPDKERKNKVGGTIWDVSLAAHGPNMVWEPTHLCKILYVEWGSRTWTECYLFENASHVAHDDINDHVEAIDTIEKFCNRNIFKNVKAVKEGQEASTSKPPTIEELGGK